MPEVASLRPGDPRRLGEYSIDGPLADDSVYLARSDTGERVAIKVFRSRSAAVLAAVQKVRLPDAYHTVQIIDSGVADGLPYIVMEFVDGDTLERTVAGSGPLRGAALHRLAISTMTALVAIHQAGAVHDAFGPDNVLLGPDGPTMINTGVAQAVVTTAEDETRRVESLAYLAPEHFAGEPPGPAADVFAWAATMVFAASGRSPFDGGSMSATTNRVLRADPDLGMLDEHLRGVVADCLAKDPGLRPAAGDVLLKLVGHSLLTVAPGELAPVIPKAEPPRRSWRFAVLSGAGGLVIALASAGTVYTLLSRTPPPPATHSATPTPSVVTLAAEPTPSPPPSPVGSLALPGPAASLYENPADPVQVVAYRTGENVYVRAPGTDRFRKLDEQAAEIAASPDGAWLALIRSGTVSVVDRAGGQKFTVATGPATLPTWSRDGRRLLVTTTRGTEVDGRENPVPSGFVIIDLATRKAATIVTAGAKPRDLGAYGWLPDGTGVAVTYQTAKDYGMRVRDLAGRETRTLNWVGYARGPEMFSPSGKLFATSCPSGGTYCIWDLAEGGRRTTVGLLARQFPFAEFWGWYDEDHVLVLDPGGRLDRVLVMDPLGHASRVLLTIAAKDYAARGKDFSVTMVRR
ncbi:protein kinase [Nonomuraea sp. NPDC049141]|uniref:protein kinase domain-containing protein n=1 Tax=Nonomuraea sp. NPDC049141 TaxID=3155500 RepID=UPI00340CBDFE